MPHHVNPIQKAREFRQHPTKSEKRMWQMVRAHQISGLGFRRQHPVAGFFLDFYCPALKLAVELDGRRHNKPAVWRADLYRDEVLRSLGIEIIHFSDSWIEEALPQIRATLEKVVRWRAAALAELEQRSDKRHHDENGDGGNPVLPNPAEGLNTKWGVKEREKKYTPHPLHPEHPPRVAERVYREWEHR